MFPSATSLVSSLACALLIHRPRVKGEGPSTSCSQQPRKHGMTGTGGGGEHYSREVCELCGLLLTIIYPAPPGRASVSRSPAAAASMLLGVSVALMLCGSITFAIGFFLMPWVADLSLLFGFAGAVNTLSSGLFLCTKQPATAAAVPGKHSQRRIVGHQ